MFVVAFGSLVDWLTVVGPFADYESALDYCKDDKSDWTILELVTPTKKSSCENYSE